MAVDRHLGGVEIDGRQPWRDLRRFSHEAMATVFEVYAVHPDAAYAAQAARAAFDLADALERDLSRFLPNSDIGRINHLSAGDRTQVSPSTMECLVIARHCFDLSGGAFDVSLGTGLPALDLHPEDCLVRATCGGARVDLGGIGKGYAVDRMAGVLEEWGLDLALVHGGFSSVLALEAPPGCDGWPLTLSDPGLSRGILARLSVRGTALGASGLRRGDHIVDPRTGDPVGGRRGAWALVPRPEPSGAPPPGEPPARLAAVADALATAFMLLPFEAIEALCEGNPGLEAWILQEPATGSREPGQVHRFGAPRAGPTDEAR